MGKLRNLGGVGGHGGGGDLRGDLQSGGLNVGYAGHFGLTRQLVENFPKAAGA